MQFSNGRLCLLVLGSLVAVGCGGGASDKPKVAAVSGTVTYKGAPVEGATVSFWKEGAPRAGTGQTDAKGNFQLTTFDPNDGAVIGNHTATVVKSAAASTMSAADMAGGTMKAAEVKDPLPAKYADAKTSPLKFEVKSGPNTVKLELTD
jgi:hypothetical protein